MDVKVGQVWENCDPRTPGKQFVVVSINEKLGYIITKKTSGRFGRVKITRLKPRTNGYKLIRDVA